MTLNNIVMKMTLCAILYSLGFTCGIYTLYSNRDNVFLHKVLGYDLEKSCFEPIQKDFTSDIQELQKQINNIPIQQDFTSDIQELQNQINNIPKNKYLRKYETKNIYDITPTHDWLVTYPYPYKMKDEYIAYLNTMIHVSKEECMRKFLTTNKNYKVAAQLTMLSHLEGLHLKPYSMNLDLSGASSADTRRTFYTFYSDTRFVETYNIVAYNNLERNWKLHTHQRVSRSEGWYHSSGMTYFNSTRYYV